MLKLNAVQAPSALLHDIEARVARGEKVSQEEWDRAAGAFNDDDIDELVPPDPPAPRRPLNTSPLAQILRDIFEEDRRKK